MARYLGGLTTTDETQVRPANNFEDTAGNGVFTSDEQLMLNKQSLYPTAGNSNPAKFVENVFSVDTYTGNGSTQSITNGIDLSGEGGLVWIKWRTGGGLGSNDNALFDTVRGVNNIIYSNSTGGQNATGTGSNASLSAFNSNGFSLGADNMYGRVNTNNAEQVAWTFRKAPKFFDVVQYSGTGSEQSIAHNLGQVPGMIIHKRTDTNEDWRVYHRMANGGSSPEDYIIQLNGDSAYSNDNTNFGAPTSTHFVVKTSSGTNNGSGTYIAYLFGHDTSSDGMIQCGTFDTDSSGNYDGSTALGFEPQWLMVKAASTSGHWFIHDSLRGISDVTMTYLLANSTNAESSFSADRLRLTSQGFVFEGSHLEASDTYIYMAIAKGPMATPTSRASVFAVTNETSATLNDSPPFKQVSNFPVDFVINKMVGASSSWWSASRITNARLQLESTAAETSVASTHEFDHNDGVAVAGLYGATNFMGYMFRRAPEFFDVVTYDGDGGVSTVQPHNLTVVPEMIWYKARSEVGNWGFYHKDLVSTQRQVYLNLDHAGTQSYGSFIAPTTTQFAVGGNACAGGTNNTNKSGEKYVAFLFATLSGISKVGSFSHTNGSSTDVACGFSSGSAMVIVKRTDATGDWFVWDSARGIVAGDDDYMLLNSTAAEVTNTDYIDPLNSGFQIASGFTTGDYIFYAIAA